MWNKNQLRTCSDALETVDKLLITKPTKPTCKRNQAVTYYDYQQPNDKVHHDWIMKF